MQDSQVVTVSDMFREAMRFSRLIDAGIEELRKQARSLSEAEHAYRQAKAEAWVDCPTDDPGTKRDEKEWPVARREAWVDAKTAHLRQARDLADAMRSAALEAVRSRRTQLSAIQTFANAEREEAAFERTRPEAA